MANLKVNNYHNLKFRINGDEYWDFYVNKDSYGSFKSNGIYDKCLISYIDLCDSECFDDSNWIYGKSEYYWDNSNVVGHTLYNISYIGVDNGLFTYRRDRIMNKDFLKLFRENNYKIEENDYRLKLHAVSGNTLQYEYPLHKEECCTKLNGGFYQGFFKTECDKYQVLPSKFNDGDILNFEFTLKKCDLEKESDKTLNDKYPQNKGIFFYLGTRAENKWIYLYEPDDGCEQLGMGDYVDGGEIDKKTYIINSFLDVRLDDEMDIDDYTDYDYYDDRLYAIDKCDWEDMSDYVDLEYDRKAKIIDKNAPHITLDSYCCNGSSSDSLKPFFRGCGCPISYKKVSDGGKKEEVGWFDPFGDDYISGWDGLEDSGVDCEEYLENDIDISDFDYETDSGFKLDEGNQYSFKTDNKFLFFNRTNTGYTVSNWVEGTEFVFQGRRSQFKGNLFILMNRTKTGYTVSNIDELRDKDANKYNYLYKDIYDNALAFRITDEGEIGYRILTKNCEIEGENKSEMLEGYSNKNVIPNCEWTNIDVKAIFLGGNKMKFMFYVNGKLVYITKELPRINMRALGDVYDKQEGVPYNISLGGGTQGLCDTVQTNYMLNPSRVYPLEKYFAGTFIGYVKSFKIYDCMVEPLAMENNYKIEKKNMELEN